MIASEAGWCVGDRHALREAALLHDLGRVCSAEGGAAPGETIALGHDDPANDPELGAQIASVALEPRQVSWIRHHRERWDGTGTPDGLAGSDIPDGAMIIGLSDAYDRMVVTPTGCDLTRDEAVVECMRAYRKRFAPWIVDLVIDLADRLPEGGADDRPAPLRLVSAA
jgi:HD-GYP domain-containing protein (c-di-GMP phosphodiesterase class II)